MSKSKALSRVSDPKLDDTVEAIDQLNKVRAQVNLPPVGPCLTVEMGKVYTDLLAIHSMAKILNWTICERSDGEGDPINDWADYSNQLDVIQDKLGTCYRTVDRLILTAHRLAAPGGTR